MLFVFTKQVMGGSARAALSSQVFWGAEVEKERKLRMSSEPSHLFNLKYSWTCNIKYGIALFRVVVLILFSAIACGEG